MPVNPSTYQTGAPLTASQLNTDLYTFVPGNNHNPNGILFHSLPPMYWANSSWQSFITQPSGSAGSEQAMNYPQMWSGNIDNSGYYSPNIDETGLVANGIFTPAVNGTGGLAGSGSGWYLAFGLTAFSSTNNADASGSMLFYNGAAEAVGGLQLSSVTEVNAAYVLDIIQASYLINLIQTGGYVANPNTISLGGLCADSSNADYDYEVAPIPGGDYTSLCCYLGCTWAAPMSGNCVVPSSLPSPPATYTSASAITSALLNGNGLAAPLQFLNNKPVLRVAAALSTSIPTHATITPTLVPFGNNVSIDNWSGYSTSTSLYTAPVSGVYLVHGSVGFAASTAGQRVCGIRINGSATIWGPSHSATGLLGARPQITRLLDLNAGDTVGIVVCQSSGAALALSGSGEYEARMVIMWMSSLAGSDGSVAWSPPNTNYRWTAGSPGSSMTALFNEHLTSDLYFLIQRPYLLSHQTVQQTGLPQNAGSVITCDSLTGQVHGSAGDNYGGWTSGASNNYAAVVPGWYLIVAGYSQAAPSATPAHCVATSGYYQEGGAQQGAGSAYISGQRVSTVSTTFGPGAEMVALCYLREGDYIQPVYGQLDGGATYSTNVSNGQNSFFGAVWISELGRGSGPMGSAQGHSAHGDRRGADLGADAISPSERGAAGGRPGAHRAVYRRPREIDTGWPRWLSLVYRLAILVGIAGVWGVVLVHAVKAVIA